MPHIYVDADDCAVRYEVFRVAKRYSLRVTLVANRGMYTPDDERVDMVVVPDQLDAADDWIVEHVQADDIVICSDIPLVSRCLKNGARAMNSRGRCFTDNDMGETLATRDLLKSLREAGMQTSGPKPFGPRDRSQFLQSLDREIVAAQKSRRRRR